MLDSIRIAMINNDRPEPGSATNTLADLARRFADPPREYSPVPIWWWSGERLDPARLRWQLEQFVAVGVYNLVILNLAPAGPLYGSDADDPPCFSEAWWQIFLGVCADARELGVRLWFYDQIGFSGANLQGGLVRHTPEFVGQWLDAISVEGAGSLTLACPPGGEPLGAAVTDLDSGVTTPVELNDLRANDDRPGRRRLRLIYAARRGFDYFNPVACAALIDTVHGAFERRAGAFFGDVIVGSFQDELPSLPTWSAGFLEAFRAQAGYDLRPRLGLLWEGEDAVAQRARADYHAVRASLAEAAFFKPLFDWHERHRLTCGFDQQGPARAGDPIASVRIYADYLKTQRWYGAPGSDHHGDAKIHSSLAHLYNQPRTWIEAFHSSGWGGTLEETFDWLLPWLRAGATLYSPHAAYYSTRGGWWEWAPPSTCWRQPYWRHYRGFADAISRLCDLLSQGRHVCDIGLLYPTTTIQSQTTPTGPLPAARAAHDAYLALVGSMAWHATRPGLLDRDRRDYDVLDDDSVQRATVEVGALVIGAERFRAIVLPGVSAMAAATAGVLAHFVEAGGLLIAVGQIPEIAVGAGPAEAVDQLRRLFAEGRAAQVAGPEDLPAALARLPRDVDAPGPTLHRRIGDRDVLFIPAAFPRATEVSPTADWREVAYTFDPARYARQMTVRVRGARGAPQLWDVLTGRRRNLTARQVGDTVEVVVPFDRGPAAILVWPAPGEEEALPLAVQATETTLLQLERWQGELELTLDNRYGDLDRPAYSGAPPVQTWRFENWGDEAVVQSPEHLQAEYWSRAEVGFAAYGWWFGPAEPARLPGPLVVYEEGPDALCVEHLHPAIYSLSRGIDRDPIHTRSLGPKGHVPEEFLDFGLVRAGEAIHFRTAIWMPKARALHLALGAAAAKRAWINAAPVGEDQPGYHWLAPVALRTGMNILDIEFTAEEDVRLRASWALVTRPERYARPEWMTAGVPATPGARVTFSAALDLTFTPEITVFQIGANAPCRVRINGVEIVRHGGFDPWEGSPAVQRFSTRALRAGTNNIKLEALEPGVPLAIVVDGLAYGPTGERAALMSGRNWRARRGDDPETDVTLRRRQWFSPTGSGAPTAPDMDPAFANLWRRPHPLPGSAWLEDVPADDTVLPIIPDAQPGQASSEWFRWTLAPGATSMRLPIAGAARLWVDEVELPIVDGRAILPAVAVGRVALLGVAPLPGRNGGGVFEGPVTYETGRGPIDLRPWAELGLGAYSGGLRYRTTFTLPDRETGNLTLDLGQVRGTAEVWLNGAPAGVRFLSPYRFALTGLARAGENTLEVLVCNTLAPYLQAVSPTHYVFPGQEASGLLGPVTLRRQYTWRDHHPRASRGDGDLATRFEDDFQEMSMTLPPIKPALRPRIGLYSTGLRAYWAQFPGLRERLIAYGQHIARRLSEWAEVVNFGLVDTEGEGRRAGEWFQSQNVDLVFCHAATYSTSSTVLPVHQICGAPVVFLNLQPTARINYAASTTGEWLAHCNACAVPEFSNAIVRAGLPFRVVNGLLGLDATPAISLADEVTFARPEAIRAWREIEGWVRAAGVKRTLQHARFGFLGNTYSGMLDLYSDFAMIQAQTGLHVEVLEMSDLSRLLKDVTESDVRAKRAEIEAMFEISGDSPSDPIARRPTEEQMDWSCRVAAAQERLVRAFDLDALCYYVHGAPGELDERIQAGFIVGHSLLTARGIPCSGEGDLKTAVAMKICDILGVGGSFSEIVVVDYDDQTILLGHDGPFHSAIAEGKPILRGMGLFHGKQGSGVSVEAKVRRGPITTLNLTQTGEGRLKLISGEGESTDGPIMQIGNTQTPVRFEREPDAHLTRWFAEAPTHHCAMAVGHNAALFAKVGALLRIGHVTL